MSERPKKPCLRLFKAIDGTVNCEHSSDIAKVQPMNARRASTIRWKGHISCDKRVHVTGVARSREATSNQSSCLFLIESPRLLNSKSLGDRRRAHQKNFRNSSACTPQPIELKTKSHFVRFSRSATVTVSLSDLLAYSLQRGYSHGQLHVWWGATLKVIKGLNLSI